MRSGVRVAMAAPFGDSLGEGKQAARRDGKQVADRCETGRPEDDYLILPTSLSACAQASSAFCLPCSTLSRPLLNACRMSPALGPTFCGLSALAASVKILPIGALPKYGLT